MRECMCAYRASGQNSGCSSLRPWRRKIVMSKEFTSEYGGAPRVMSSQSNTPNDHCVRMKQKTMGYEQSTYQNNWHLCELWPTPTCHQLLEADTKWIRCAKQREAKKNAKPINPFKGRVESVFTEMFGEKNSAENADVQFYLKVGSLDNRTWVMVHLEPDMCAHAWISEVKYKLMNCNIFSQTVIQRQQYLFKYCLHHYWNWLNSTALLCWKQSEGTVGTHELSTFTEKRHKNCH